MQTILITDREQNITEKGLLGEYKQNHMPDDHSECRKLTRLHSQKRNSIVFVPQAK